MGGSKLINLSGKWAYAWAVFFTVIILAVQSLGQLLFQWIGGQLGLEGGVVMALLAAPPFLCVLITAFFVMKLNSISWVGSFWYLGFKKLNPRQLAVGLLSLVPVAVGDGLSYLYCFQHGISVEPFKHWFSLWLVILVTAGFFEEVFFRGFIFQTLRQKGGLLKTAVFSSALWGVSHGVNFLGGFDQEIFLTTIATAGVSFFLGLAAAYVFERGGNVIWGWSLAHVLFDSMGKANVDHKGLFSLPTGLPLLYQVAGIALCVMITFPLGRWLLPVSKKKEI